MQGFRLQVQALRYMYMLLVKTVTSVTSLMLND